MEKWNSSIFHNFKLYLQVNAQYHCNFQFSLFSREKKKKKNPENYLTPSLQILYRNHRNLSSRSREAILGHQT